MDTRLDSKITAPTSLTLYPTYRNQSTDSLDIAIIKAGCLGYHLENLSSELSSDHSPILLDIHQRSEHVPPPKPLYIYHRLEKIWNRYGIQALATSKNNSCVFKILQLQVDIKIQWNQWKITINLLKTTSIFSVTNKLKMANALNLEITLTKLENIVKYLGVTKTQT